MEGEAVRLEGPQEGRSNIRGQGRGTVQGGGKFLNTLGPDQDDFGEL